MAADDSKRYFPVPGSGVCVESAERNDIAYFTGLRSDRGEPEHPIPIRRVPRNFRLWPASQKTRSGQLSMKDISACIFVLIFTATTVFAGDNADILPAAGKKLF